MRYQTGARGVDEFGKDALHVRHAARRLFCDILVGEDVTGGGLFIPIYSAASGRCGADVPVV